MQRMMKQLGGLRKPHGGLGGLFGGLGLR
jgi:hypothetical protein